MSSIWSSTATHMGTSSFATTGTAPPPGGGAATKFQSMLSSGGEPAGRSGASGASSPVAATADPADSSSGTGSSSNSATITANDFLTLLVTEMQNQDPTAQTDPNAYIDQLVQINSLEQLISINQNLSTVLSSASGSGAGSGSGGTGSGTGNNDVPVPGNGAQAQKVPIHTGRMPAVAPKSTAVHGNLSVPRDAPAAHTVARALDGHVPRTGQGHGIRDIPTRALP